MLDIDYGSAEVLQLLLHAVLVQLGGRGEQSF